MLQACLSLTRFYASKVKGIIKKTNHKTKKSYISETKLDPASIPKFVNQLVKPPVYVPYRSDAKTGDIIRSGIKTNTKKNLYLIDISEFKQQILPEGYPATTVWGYGGLIRDHVTGRVHYERSSPGATFEMIRNVPVKVKWINRLKNPNLFAVDPTLHWANPNNMPMDPPKPWPPFPPGFHDAQRPVPIVTHLHGGENPSAYDGHPDAWFTVNGKTGGKFLTSTYTYLNRQEAATLWYHDHVLGITRLSLYAGLAGFYLLRGPRPDGKDKDSCRRFVLPHGRFEIPILIQDRSFLADGSFSFPNVGNNPDIHPYWMPEFFGDAIMVNGKVWPSLDVERRQYRFRLLNGSNARFYNLRLSNGLKMIQIGSDGGFLPHPAELTSLLLAPAERADILIDFSGMKPGTNILLLNDANAPYPVGEAPDPNSTEQIMQFKVPVNASVPVIPNKLPDTLNKLPLLIPDSPRRILTLFEVDGANGPSIILLDGQKWSSPISENPLVSSTEEWIIANLTPDAHPIHVHLVQFRLLNRQLFKASEYGNKWLELNGMPPFNHPTRVLEVEPYLLGTPNPPDENEKGWKDTIRMNPSEITRILIRFAPQDIPSGAAKPGVNLYPFDPSSGPGYVWHCHMLDHEDNEMMRPYKVKLHP